MITYKGHTIEPHDSLLGWYAAVICQSTGAQVTTDVYHVSRADAIEDAKKLIDSLPAGSDLAEQIKSQLTVFYTGNYYLIEASNTKDERLAVRAYAGNAAGRVAANKFASALGRAVRVPVKWESGSADLDPLAVSVLFSSNEKGD